VADFLEVALKYVLINLWQGTEEMDTVLLWGDLRESDHLENLGLGGKITLNMILKK
jgi:hypothetical protein